MRFTHKFVELVPEPLEEGVVYVSIRYKTASHRCACGCGQEVVTPLSPVYWKITFDGETISLSPSIGKWEFRCRSHYWITNNRIEWSGDWTEEQIKACDAKERCEKERFYNRRKTEEALATANDAVAPPESLWSKFKKRWLWR
jgi:hypothetical protein